MLPTIGKSCQRRTIKKYRESNWRTSISFLSTDDFERDFKKYNERNIKFIRPPQNFAYGRVVVFEDLYGNKWDLLQPDENSKGHIITL